MKKLLYLLVAGTFFTFTACNCGAGDAATEEVVVEEEAAEEVVEDTTAVEEVEEATEE